MMLTGSLNHPHRDYFRSRGSIFYYASSSCIWTFTYVNGNCSIRGPSADVVQQRLNVACNRDSYTFCP